ncbi:MAG: STAS domain-containing protein [Rhodococcus sp.]|nr:STAS domain-containing protein [Rhodococcus sp. (in: high G+C Gram-positive bacteria)]
MNIGRQEQSGILTLVLEGRVDSIGAGELEVALDEALEQGHNKLVLDMAGVQYINSAGLRTLADAVTRARNKGGDVRLAALTPRVARVFKIIGFDRFFEDYPTVEDAYYGL